MLMVGNTGNRCIFLQQFIQSFDIRLEVELARPVQRIALDASNER